MKKRIPIGIEFYKRIVDDHYYYVDKTLLIKDLLEKGGQVNLFTRPRRFGKTLALTMIQTFFEDERDSFGNHLDTRHYFNDTAIEAAGETYMQHQGQYPVIFMTLKSAKQPTFADAYWVMKNSIIQQFEHFSFILDSKNLGTSEQTLYRKIMNDEAERSAYATSLAFLCNCLEKHFGKKAILLLDEYDVPLENAFYQGFYDEMSSFVRSLFESALKTNDSLAFAVITGCLRISRESIFTGLNNLTINSILSADYGEYFGFTPVEVERMLDYYQLDSKKEEARIWYDGYLFGNSEVYNPWSIINYVREACADIHTLPKPYWSNTSSNQVVRDLIEQADVSTRQEIEKLINGACIEKPLHEDITYDSIHKNMDNLWNFLFFTGYLKKCGERLDQENIYTTLTIPNAEIRYIYRNTILSWFDDEIGKKDFTRLYKAILEQDCETMGNIISEQLMETISFFDYAESYYHGFMAGLLKGMKGYLVQSNREGGLGRSDIILKEMKFRGKAFIMEYKIAQNFSEMNMLAQKALKQINSMSYEADLRNEGISDIIKYGICFCKKGCVVCSDQ